MHDPAALPYACVVTACATAAFVARAGLRPQSQLFGRTLIAGSDAKEVALTYDDGPNDLCTEPLLELLDRHNTKATFFMIGGFVRQRPALARKVYEAGHLVANHTMTHPWLAWQSASRIREELRGCQDALQDAIGAPVHYFRPPHGARRPYVMRAARELGLTTVLWNVMGSDWLPIDAPQIVQRIDKDLAKIGVGRGANILLHDGGDQAMGTNRSETIKATAILLDRFHAEAKRMVRIDVWK